MNSEPHAQLNRLFAVMARLRGPGGCPWDQAQDHLSLIPHLLEETHELIAAVEANDPLGIVEELGDLLVQVAMHSAIGSERGAFDLEQVAARAATKMISRHPHVFEGAEVVNEEQLLQNWDQLKRNEKPERTSSLDGIPDALPALALASSYQRRGARAGPAARALLPHGAQTMPRLQEAMSGRPGESDQLIGDLLWSVVALARELNVDPEGALRRSARSWAASVRQEEMAEGSESDG